jgi:hypothetical protein
MTAATAYWNSVAFEDELRFDTFGRETPWKRTLPDTTIQQIPSAAPKRRLGELLPENNHEDNDVAFPIIPTNTAECESKLWSLSPDLSFEQTTELLNLLAMVQ